MVKTCQPLPIDLFGFGILLLDRCKRLDSEMHYPKTICTGRRYARIFWENLGGVGIGVAGLRYRDWYYEAVPSHAGLNTP